MNKKGGFNYGYVILTALFLVVVGSLYGLYAGWFNPDVQETPTATPTSTVGELGTLKVSAESLSGDTPLQIATTGYVWDVTTPNQLIESRNGKTLSTSAGTTFSPAYRGHSYEATAFSSSQYCQHKSGKMSDEGLELRISCKNLTGTTQVKATFYEDDVAETTRSINLGAGATNNYNKFMFEVNVSDRVFPLKAICFGTNASNSHLKTMDVKNWNKDSIPDSLGSSADDYCFSKSEPILLEEWDSQVFQDSIVFEADTTGTGSTEELLTVTFMDACEYVTDSGNVETDYFQRETDGESDCGASNPTSDITLS